MVKEREDLDARPTNGIGMVLDWGMGKNVSNHDMDFGAIKLDQRIGIQSMDDRSEVTVEESFQFSNADVSSSNNHQFPRFSME